MLLLLSTRVTLTGETILDLIITDSPGYFISTGTLSPPFNCDYNIVYANLNISSRKQRSFKELFVIIKMRMLMPSMRHY
jgi:hypothetical protein